MTDHAPDVRAASLHPSLRDPALGPMNFLNEIAIRYPDAVSFAAGLPPERFYRLPQISTYLQAFVGYLTSELGLEPDEVVNRLFQYGPTSGIIRPLIARMLAEDEGINVAPEAIVVTSGCQEALFVTIRALFARPDDVLLVPSPGYPGVTGVAAMLGVTVQPVPEGDAGLDPETVLRAVEDLTMRGARPRVLYVVADFANPSGTRLPVAARRRLLEVAEKTGILLLEDNPYGLFAGSDHPRPTLKSIDHGRRVVYLGSFAKTGFPGMRVGYAVADQTVADAAGEHTLLADELAKIKSMVTLNTSPVAQALAGGLLLENGLSLRRATSDAAEHYRSNMACLLRTLDRDLIAGRAGVTRNSPDGGFFVVVDVPFRADEAALERSARDYGVLWTPMSFFYSGGGGERQIRLSCSAVDEAAVIEGVGRLAKMVDAC